MLVYMAELIVASGGSPGAAAAGGSAQSVDQLKRRQPITPGRPFGTRSAWMAAYAPLLSADEFTRFVVQGVLDSV